MKVSIQTITTIFLMALSFSAKAHQIQELRKASNPLVQEFLTEAGQWVGDREQIFLEPLKVLQVQPSKAGESPEQALERVMKYHLHRKYSITGDDGGYSFHSMNGQTDKALRTQLDDWFFDDQESVSKSLDLVLETLHRISNEKDLVVLYGLGSGNNTHAGIMAVLDLKNQEIIYVIVSNFGSDN